MDPKEARKLEVVLGAPEIRKSGGRTRMKFRASDESVDRYNTIIRASGWELEGFKKNPVFLWVHESWAPPVGTVADIRVEGKELLAEVEFPSEGVYPFADVVRGLFEEGILRTVSVGFKPLKWSVVEDEEELKKLGLKPPAGVVYEKQELLELSAVPVPGNSNATVLAEKALAVAEARGWRMTLQKSFTQSEQLPQLFEQLRILLDQAAAEKVRKAEALEKAVQGWLQKDPKAGFFFPLPFGSRAEGAEALKGKLAEAEVEPFLAAWEEEAEARAAKAKREALLEALEAAKALHEMAGDLVSRMEELAGEGEDEVGEEDEEKSLTPDNSILQEVKNSNSEIVERLERLEGFLKGARVIRLPGKEVPKGETKSYADAIFDPLLKLEKVAEKFGNR